MRVAVIVGRFQIEYLHGGHNKLITQAKEESDKIIILVGTSIVRSERNPLKFEMVRNHIKQLNASFEVHELKDCKKDSDWLKDLRAKVSELTNPEDEVFYYGSRDSFLSTLTDEEHIVEVEEVPGLCATDSRLAIQYDNTRGFRRGYIKAVQDEFKSHSSVVDILITDGDQVVIGYKKEGACLIGGFSDSCDNSLEEAAVREAKEETNLDIDPKSLTYLMSAKCEDWRYKHHRQPFSSVFVAKVDNFDGIEAGDDIDRVETIEIEEALLLLDGHHELILKEYIDSCL